MTEQEEKLLYLFKPLGNEALEDFIDKHGRGPHTPGDYIDIIGRVLIKTSLLKIKEIDSLDELKDVKSE